MPDQTPADRAVDRVREWFNAMPQPVRPTPSPSYIGRGHGCHIVVFTNGTDDLPFFVVPDSEDDPVRPEPVPVTDDFDNVQTIWRRG